MKTFGFVLILIAGLFLLVPFQSCEPEDDIDDCDTTIVAYKPNIYLYPTEELQLRLELHFPLGGELIASIPEYGSGWEISVDETGLIDESYSFLFYESIQPDVWQKSFGWVVKKSELEPFFRNNLFNYGFRGNEIDDFIEYWVPRLEDYEFYSIFPQTNETIDRVIEFHASQVPDQLLRLFYLIKGYNEPGEELNAPVIQAFKREGFYVCEWGVLL